MLRTYARRNVDDDLAEREPSFAEFFEFVYGVFRQQILVVLAIAILTIGVGTLYVLTTPPTFTAHTTMIIGRGTVQVQLGGILSEVPVEVESQTRLIKSEAVALAVVKKFNLDEDPELIGPSPGIRTWLRSLLSDYLPPRPPPDPEYDPARAAASNALDRLKVTRMGYVFEIEFSSLKPERAAQIANAFADAYVEDQVKRKRQSAEEASVWLKDQIQELRDQSLRADEAVAQFKAKHNIVSADGRLITDQQITLLNGQLVLAREKTAETRARLDRIEAVINANSPDTEAIATVTDTLNNPIIVKLRTQYLELTGRESLWSREYGAKHLAVVNLRRQIREILSSIHDELRRIGETYKSEHEIAKQRQAELEIAVAEAKSQYQETSQALTTLRDLESSAETYRGLYRTALQRGTELVQKQSYPGAEARLITRAATPTQQSSPTALVVLGASAVGGLLLGFGAGLLRTLLDRVFRTPAQIEATLHAKCLALAPMINPPAVKRAKRTSQLSHPHPRTISRSASVIWEVVDQPLSRFSEAMRSIKLEAHLNGATVLGFTSSLPKEGKSTIAAAFALLTAQAGSRTILIDCDLRNPTLSALLAPKAENGLMEVISGKMPLEDVAWNELTTNLAFLPAVMTKSRAAQSSTILSSSSLRAFFETLRQRYDSVIVDFSPAAPIIDVQSTVGLVDSYVFVVEWGRTKIEVAELSLSRASVIQKSLLGVVLNKVDFKVLRQYEGYRREYYSDKHYGQYGQV